MLLESEFAERRHGVRLEDFVCGAVRVQRERDRNQAADEVRIAVAAKMEDRPAILVRSRLALDPNLAHAPSNLVGVVVRAFGQRFQRATEFDHIAVAIFPVVQKSEVFADRFNRRQYGARGECWRHAYNPTDGSPASLESAKEALTPSKEAVCPRP